MQVGSAAPHKEIAMQPDLVDLLLSKVPQFLGMPVDTQTARASLNLNA